MKNQIQSLIWDIDKVWALVEGGRKTQSKGREDSERLIIEFLLSLDFVKKGAKKEILRIAGYLHQSEYARRIGKLRQYVSRNVKLGKYDDVKIIYNNRTYLKLHIDEKGNN